MGRKTGRPAFPLLDPIPFTPLADLEAAVSELNSRKEAWVALGLDTKIRMLQQAQAGFERIGSRWVAESCRRKGTTVGSWEAAEEWMALGNIQRILRMTARSLTDLRRGRTPRIPGPVTVRGDGQVVAQVFPVDHWDRVLYSGCTGEVWMEPGVERARLADTQAVTYREGHPGKVALVLGAGNWGNLIVGDLVSKLFVEQQVAVLKLNPVNERLGPLLAEALEPFIRGGFLRLAYGGVEQVLHLAHHRGVDELHMTGSEAVYNAIVFGPGEEGRARRQRGERILTKRFTAELGSVSPVIVVPGPWQDQDLRYQAEHLASMLIANAGFNCLSPRVIVQHAQWNLRRRLLEALRDVLRRTPTRPAYYPNAARIQAEFVEAHPQAEQFGAGGEGHLPWTLIAELDPSRADDICFTTEPWCGLFSETAIEAASLPEFLEKAVALANDTLAGTLSCNLVVHPATLRDPSCAAALERAVANLRYGTVGVNRWPLWGYATGTTTWGAFPGHPPQDIQSGTGVVNNLLMFSRPQKSVIRGPFRILPRPPFFPSHLQHYALAERLAGFERSPSLSRLTGILWPALRG
ncbi:MAG: aldehyde dehydrogenase [Bradymonadales bacterium]|nr:aldehyde dehydrogenase [Bradymonadales bacterium]